MRARKPLIGRWAACLTLAITACGVTPASEIPSTTSTSELTVWYFDKVSMDAVIPLFEQSHPGVRVKFVQQPFGDMSKKYLAALVAGEGVPDVVGLDTSMVGRFLDAGENLLDDPYDAGQLRSDFVDWKFDAAISSDGQMAAMPWDVATGVMFYRPSVFAAAGLPTEPPEVASTLVTWDDFISAGQAIKSTSGGQSAIVGSEHDIFNAAFWQNGGNVVEDGSIVLVPEGLAPLQTAIKARDAGIGAKIPAWSERWAPGLQSGKIATVLAGGWMLGNLQNFIDPDGAGNWRVATPPGGPFSNGGTYIQIPKLAEHKQLAWEFIEFVTTNQAALDTVFEKTGIVPAFKPAWSSPVYDQPVAYLGGEPAFRLMLDLAQQVKPVKYSPVDALGTDLLNTEVDAAISGNKTPGDALNSAANDLQERALHITNLQLPILEQ